MKSTLSQATNVDLLTIGQLSHESGIPASTIRYWERIGVMPRPPRHGGQRRYTRDAIHRLAVLRMAQACGFRLEEMRELAGGFRVERAPSARWQELARTKAAEIDEQVARLLAMREVVKKVAACQCVDWNECGRRAATALGDSRA